MNTYPQETLTLVQSLIDRGISQRQINITQNIPIHSLREIFQLLNAPKKKQGERAITVQYEIERCCLSCKEIKPITAFERYNMKHRSGNPRVSYSTKCLDCKNMEYPSSITPDIEKQILYYRSIGYGKYPISIKLNIVLKHITMYYTAKKIIGDPPKQKEIKCIVCNIINEGSVCQKCIDKYKNKKLIKQEKSEPKQKEYKNYANRLDNPIILSLTKDIIKQVGVALRSAGYNRGRKDIFEYLGYTPQKLFDHIDNLLDKSWMTWENRTTNNRITCNDNDKSTWTWKIKHKEKIPYISLEDQDFIKAWALSNLFPAPLIASIKHNNSPNTHSTSLSHEDDQRIISLKQQGYGSRRLATIFDVNRSTIQRTFKRLGVDTIPTPTRKNMPSEKECIGCHINKPMDQYRSRIGKFADGTKRIAYEARCFACEGEQNKERCKFLLETNQMYKLRSIISFSIWNAIKNINDDTEALDFLPFSISDFCSHFESLFEPWMSWDNWGRYRVSEWDDQDQSTWVWNVDHIKPHSTFQYSSFDDIHFKECWALSNLRPLAAKQNVIEGARRTRHKMLE
jgi:hypothetical protein